MAVLLRLTPVIPLRQLTFGGADAAQCAMSDEHGALLRQMASLQRRVSAELAQYASQVTALEADNLRLRAELVRSRTAVLWGLPATALSPRPRRLAVVPEAPVVERQWREAQAVICQTGCVGHAHAWLDDQGQCRRTGEACQPEGRVAAQTNGLTGSVARPDLD